jgi:hypothetical protein
MSSRKQPSASWSAWHAVSHVLGLSSRTQPHATRRRTALRLSLLALATLWSVAAVDLEDLLSWDSFLSFLSQPSGVSLGAGILLSILVEYWPRFAAWSKKIKRVVFVGLCTAVPVVAAVLGILTLGWSPGWVDTFWPAIVTGLFVFGSGTLAHTPRLPDAPVADPAGGEPAPPPAAVLPDPGQALVIRLDPADLQTTEQAARMLAGVLGELGIEVDLSRLDSLLDDRSDASGE